MLRRRLTVEVHNGVHARPVAELVRLAQAHGAPVRLSTAAGATVELSSVLAVMDLAIEAGESVTVEVEDAPGAAGLLDAISEVLAPLSRR
ncbi:HPr family phosphocarrier protein [Microbacterium sp. USHLN186]|uniref:HPr family phosphocarrier protein n=1 Tax=Microbacterium sp. USHLN186 TaxID=3081286 RepID=UPI00301A192A